MNEKARQAAITAVYDKLHENKLGAHWLWCVIEKIAAGESEEDAMREYGYYSRAALAAQPGAVPDGAAPMTAARASFFMERFLKEEKLLGPNEQAALHFVIAMLAPTEAKPAQDAVDAELEPYDAGLLNDFGGGNVEWWQDYIRAELGRAHDFYQTQCAAISAKKGG